jgi:ubiquinone/menaquinone biosynthesis C-methylase UbiE
MLKPASGIKAFWDSFAPSYADSFEITTSVPYFSALSFLNLSSSHHIIEVGCGPGTNISLLLSHSPNHIQISASDISESMISMAQSKNLRNTTFIVADSQELPYPNEAADRYIAGFCLHLMENPRNMLAEAFRVLQPGGIAAFTIPSKLGTHNFGALFAEWLEKAGVQIQMKPFGEIQTEEMLRNTVKEAGFAKVFVCSMTSGMPYLKVEEMMRMVFGNPVISKIRNNSEEVHEKVINICEEEIRKLLDDEKIIGLGYFLAIAYKE